VAGSDLSRSCRFAYAEDLQPGRVFLGNVPDKIDAFDIALRPITLSEIDQMCAFGAEDVHPKTQCP